MLKASDFNTAVALVLAEAALTHTTESSTAVATIEIPRRLIMIFLPSFPLYTSHGRRGDVHWSLIR